MSTTNRVRQSAEEYVQVVSEAFLKDPEFRKRMCKDPEGTLKAEGLDGVHDLITKLKDAMKSPERWKAIEAGIKSGETSPSC